MPLLSRRGNGGRKGFCSFVIEGTIEISKDLHRVLRCRLRNKARHFFLIPDENDFFLLLLHGINHLAKVARDLGDFPARHGDIPPWGSATVPAAVALWCLAPGAVLTEAAGIRSPVLVALGERDVLVDPRGEPRAYESARSVDLFVCPKMGHMHNFAGTRELFWRRIETWAAWVRAVRDDARTGRGS